MLTNTAISWTFIAYTLLLLVIGVLAYRRTKKFADYILGGRSLGAWVTAISAGASDMSGWLLLGLPGYAYASGFQAFWLVAGLWCGSYLNWYFVAQRLRIFSELADDSLTLPEFFNRRFADKQNLIRILSAITIIFFFVLYTVSGLVASGKLFNSVFGIPYEWAVLLGIAVIVIYTFIGGFLAVSWTDLFQGLLMLLALCIVPVIALIELGGWQQVVARTTANNPNMFSLFNTGTDKSLGLISILSLLAWGLGYFGQPHILARFKAIRHVTQLNRARRIAMTWSGLSMLAAVAVGMMGFAYFVPAKPLDDSERVFILMIGEFLPVIIAGVCLAAILAAIMSTADSQLLVSASVLTEDIYRVFRRNSVTETHLVWVGRIVVIVIAVVATWLAMDPDSSVLELVAYAWAGFGAAFGPTLLLSLYWRAMTRAGALSGIVSGAITVLIWKQLQGGLFDVYELLPGFLVSVGMIIVVSKWLSRPDEEQQALYDKYHTRLNAGS